MKSTVPVLVVGAAVMLMTACTNPVLAALNAMSSKFFYVARAWGNNSYFGPFPRIYRVTFNGDGTMTTTDFTLITSNYTYTIDSESASGDAVTYQISISYIPTIYALIKVTSTTLEMQTSLASYPTALVPSDPINYGTYSAL